MQSRSQTSCPWIIETHDETFDRDVFERSRQLPVVVDFWALWCQPCRMLGPVLEELARRSEGRFVLVKAEMERNGRAASRLNIQAIPTVLGVCNGEVVDQFHGALGPQQVQHWLDRLVLTGQTEAARQLEQTDPAAAEQQYRRLLEQTPNHAPAAIGLARVLLAQQRVDEARQLVERLEQRGFLEPEAEKIKASLQLQQMQGTDLDAARQAAAAQPDDLQLQLQLAEALAAHQQFSEALEVCLGIIQKDKQGAGEKARQLMVDLFRVIPDEELVRTYRRRLSTLLY